MKTLAKIIVLLITLFIALAMADAWGQPGKNVKRSDRVDLTSDMKQYLFKKKNIIRIVYTDFAPYVYETYTTNNKVLHGISKELFEIFESKLPDVRFEWIRVPNTQAAIKLLLTDKADLIYNIDLKTAAEYDILTSTDSYFKSKAYPIIHRTNLTKWESVKNKNGIFDVRAAVLANSYGENYVSLVYPEVTVTVVDSPSDAIAKIVSRAADFTVMDLSQFGYYYDLFGIQNVTALTNEPFINVDKHVGIAPNQVVLKNIIDVLISSITAKEEAQLQKLWDEHRYEKPLFRSSILIIILFLLWICINNLGWYYVCVKLEKETVNRVTKKWLSVATIMADDKINKTIDH